MEASYGRGVTTQIQIDLWRLPSGESLASGNKNNDILGSLGKSVRLWDVKNGIVIWVL